MDITCFELKGILYQPKNIFPLGDNWIMGATKDCNFLEGDDQKIIFLSDKKFEKIQNDIYLFVFFYQFLFLDCRIYNLYYLSLLQKQQSFTIKCDKTQDVEAKIKEKYGENKGCFTIDFGEIKFEQTKLWNTINFNEFQKTFDEQYKKNDKFKDIIDLFLYTIGSNHPLYPNFFQKIAQLQTVFETIIGQPKGKKCYWCKQNKYKEKREVFLERILREKGITNQKDIDLITIINKTLNSTARIEYTHRSKQLNIFQETLKEIKTDKYHYKGQSSYTTNFDDIISGKLKVKDWAILDWENVYRAYQFIVRQLIYLGFFNA
ncbi:MAG: hypothetical protein WC882_00955 [Candidatus Gracilibacteria bacterium]